MRLPLVLLLLAACCLTARARGGHPVEDHYRNPAVAAIDNREILAAWKAIAELPPRAAAAELRERYTPGETSTEKTSFQGSLHKSPRGVTIVKTVTSPVYTATVTMSCRETPGGGPRVTREVDFRLSGKSTAAATAMAKRVQRELHTQEHRTYYVEGRNKYAKQLIALGQEAAERSFNNDFQPPTIEGVTIEPRIVFSQGDCSIYATVYGGGVMGSVSVRAEDSVTSELVKSMLPAYDVHVWAEETPNGLR